ncbi:MAG: hypothetical protein U1F11_05425 [Steroidobacteraceae bacterium]
MQPYLTEGAACKYVGPGAGLNRYGIAGGTILNCVALVETDSWDQEGWAHATTREEFPAHFEDFHENAQQVIKQAPADHLFKYGLRDREPLPTWIKGEPCCSATPPTRCCRTLPAARPRRSRTPSY